MEGGVGHGQWSVVFPRDLCECTGRCCLPINPERDTTIGFKSLRQNEGAEGCLGPTLEQTGRRQQPGWEEPLKVARGILIHQEARGIIFTGKRLLLFQKGTPQARALNSGNSNNDGVHVCQ